MQKTTLVKRETQGALVRDLARHFHLNLNHNLFTF